jgi:hypothetical protein
VIDGDRCGRRYMTAGARVRAEALAGINDESQGGARLL